MKKLIVSTFIAGLIATAVTSCNDNQAAPAKPAATKATEKKETAAPVKKDSAAMGNIQTTGWEMKLHRAFVYAPAGSEVLAGFTPKPGFKFMYLDVSLKNTGADVVDGGQIFIALKITGSDGKEYKKPAAGLAAFTTENPNASNLDEYNAMWEKFEANEFHRELVYCVEVPADMKEFTLSLPADRLRKEWKEIKFSL
jgi:hypothetical protein